MTRATDSSPASGVPRVLIVDPSPHLRHYLARALERSGYEVQGVHGPEEGLARVQADPPDVILLEFDLEGRSGIELCRDLRALPGGDSLVLLFTTAHAYTSADTLKEAAADWYFPKPVCVSYLLRKLEELLGERASGPRGSASGSLRERLTRELRALVGIAGIELPGLSLRHADETWSLDPASFTWAPHGPPGPTPGAGVAALPVHDGERRWTLEITAEGASRRVEELCRAAVRAAELEARCDALCGELESASENLASISRLHFNQNRDGHRSACLEVVLEELTRGREAWSAAFFLPEEGRMRPVVWSHGAPAALTTTGGAIADMLRTGRGCILDPRARPELSFAGAGPLAIAPLPLGKESAGCVAVWSRDGSPIEERSMGRISLLAHQAGTALYQAILHEERTRSQRLHQEHALAGRIQDSILRSTAHGKNPRLELAAVCAPCGEVAGDFYEVLDLGEECMDLVVGDVMGKGLPAAVFAAAVKNELLRQLAAGGSRREPGRDADPASIVRGLNLRLAEELERFESFATLLYARFDLTSDTFRFIDCGHTNALHYRASEGRVIELAHDPEGITNLPLGIRHDCEFVEARVGFGERDIFVMYSDGVTEAHDGSRPYGVERLGQVLLGLSEAAPEEIARSIQADLEAFLGGTPAGDDITLLVVRVGARVARDDDSISLLAQGENVGPLREFLQARLERCSGIDRDPVRWTLIELAVVEAATNIAEHAFEERTNDSTERAIRVECEETEDRLLVHLFDRGRGFDPSTAPPPPFETTRSGGYGVFIMNEVAEEVLHGRESSGENRLTLAFQKQVTETAP